MNPAVAHNDDWDKHWDEYADTAASNPAQRFRRRLILELLHLGSGPARVLDIGCGQGDLIADLHKAHPNAELCGTDYSQWGIDIAAKKVPTAQFFARDLLQDGKPPENLAGWATHAVCSEVLEHVDEPETLLRNARAYLAPGCRLVVTVPGGPMSAFDRHIGHRRHYTPKRLRETLRAACFEVETVTGAGFPLFNVYRAVVILRGQGLVGDIVAGSPSLPPRLAMGLFRALLAIPAPHGRWGWQLVGVGRAASSRPGSPAPAPDRSPAAAARPRSPAAAHPAPTRARSERPPASG